MIRSCANVFFWSLILVTLSALPTRGASANIMEWGALGNGVHDDASSIQSAVNYVQATGGGCVIVPQGTFLITSTVTWTSKTVSWCGESKQSSIIWYSGAGAGVVFDPPTSNEEVRGSHIAHLQFACSPSVFAPGQQGTGLQMSEVSGYLIDDVIFNGCQTGLLLKNDDGTDWSEEITLRGSFFLNNIYGIYMQGLGSSMAYSHLNFYCERNRANVSAGACLSVEDGTRFYNSNVTIRANLAGTASVVSADIIQADQSAEIWNDVFDIQFEGGNSYVFAVGISAAAPPGGEPENIFLNIATGGSRTWVAKTGNPAWAASTHYNAGAIVASSCADGDVMIATDAGTSGTVAPAWNCAADSAYSTTFGLTTTDNQITWRDEGQYAGWQGGVTPAIITPTWAFSP